MIDFSKPVQTKNGHHVTIVTLEGRGNCPVLGYIGESKKLQMWYSDGIYIAESLRGSYNLINSPEYWVKEKEAFAHGKTIQYRNHTLTEWSDLSSAGFTWFSPHEYFKPQYRIKPNLIPLTKDDVKAGDTFFHSNAEYQWTVKRDGSVMLGSFWRTYKDLFEKGWQMKSLNETEWRPCEKEEV